MLRTYRFLPAVVVVLLASSLLLPLVQPLCAAHGAQTAMPAAPADAAPPCHDEPAPEPSAMPCDDGALLVCCALDVATAPVTLVPAPLMPVVAASAVLLTAPPPVVPPRPAPDRSSAPPPGPPARLLFSVFLT